MYPRNTDMICVGNIKVLLLIAFHFARPLSRHLHCVTFCLQWHATRLAQNGYVLSFVDREQSLIASDEGRDTWAKMPTDEKHRLRT